MSEPFHDEPIGTYVLVQGTVYRRVNRYLKRAEYGWLRVSVPLSAKPGKRTRVKNWFEIGRLPKPYEVIDEAAALEIQKSSVEEWMQKLRDAAVQPSTEGAET